MVLCSCPDNITFNVENEEEVRLGEVDSGETAEPTTIPAEKETDNIFDSFLKLAGEDKEVDWEELKELLDYALKNDVELPVVTAISTNVKSSCETNNDTNESVKNGFFTALLSVICIPFHTESHIGEIIPISEHLLCTALHHPSTNEMKIEGFSKDLCRSMVAMLDVDRSGKLGFEEFQKLWANVRKWKDVFKSYDKDSSGALSGFELRQALNSAGFRLNWHILNILMHRYGNKSGEISFDDFILCATKLNTMFELFKQNDPKSTNSAMFNLDNWLETTLYT